MTAAAPLLRGRPLRRGDRVALVAPSSPFGEGVVEAGRAELARLGYDTVCDEAVFLRDGYLAGSAEARAEAFLRAWADPSVAALVAVRGGYGAAHLLPRLDAERLRRTPKVFVGYSDATALLVWLTGYARIAAVHGPMLEGRLAAGPSAYDASSLTRLLAGETGLRLAPPGLAALRAGEAAGPLHGGTLAVLCASLGTPFAFDPPAGAVLFLEDVGERPYRLDRMLTQLDQAGILGRAAGVVFGEMRGCDEPGGVPRARDVLERVAARVAGPVLAGFPSGHTSGPCWSLPLGTRVRVVTAPAAAVVVEEAVVG